MKIDELNDEALATAARELVAIYAGYKAECERLSAAVEAFKAWTEGKGRRPARKMAEMEGGYPNFHALYKFCREHETEF